jgi:hypothetical protein
MSESLDENIITEENQNDFLIYCFEKKPETITYGIFQTLLEMELPNFIIGKTKWINGYNFIENILTENESVLNTNKKLRRSKRKRKTRQQFDQQTPKPKPKPKPKTPPKPKNTQPTDRMEKANLLAEAALKRLNKFNRKL